MLQINLFIHVHVLHDIFIYYHDSVWFNIQISACVFHVAMVIFWTHSADSCPTTYDHLSALNVHLLWKRSTSIYTYIMIYVNLCRFETHNSNHFRFISCYCYSKKHPLKHPNPFQVAIFIKRFENLFEGFQLIFNVLLHEVDEFTFLQVRKSSVLRRPRVVPFLHQCGCNSDEE